MKTPVASKTFYEMMAAEANKDSQNIFVPTLTLSA
jgi:hypothetical protein